MVPEVGREPGPGAGAPPAPSRSAMSPDVGREPPREAPLPARGSSEGRPLPGWLPCGVAGWVSGAPGCATGGVRPRTCGTAACGGCGCCCWAELAASDEASGGLCFSLPSREEPSRDDPPSREWLLPEGAPSWWGAELEAWPDEEEEEEVVRGEGCGGGGWKSCCMRVRMNGSARICGSVGRCLGSLESMWPTSFLRSGEYLSGTGGYLMGQRHMTSEEGVGGGGEARGAHFSWTIL